MIKVPKQTITLFYDYNIFKISREVSSVSNSLCKCVYIDFLNWKENNRHRQGFVKSNQWLLINNQKLKCIIK